MGEEFEYYDYRERCLAEKGEECTICGDSDEILVHHVDGDRTNHDIENLIPVCTGCHADIHSKRERVAEWVEKLGHKPTGPGRSTIQVDTVTWKDLNQRKEPGETFDDVIQRLLQDE